MTKKRELHPWEIAWGAEYEPVPIEDKGHLRAVCRWDDGTQLNIYDLDIQMVCGEEPEESRWSSCHRVVRQFRDPKGGLDNYNMTYAFGHSSESILEKYL